MSRYSLVLLAMVLAASFGLGQDTDDTRAARIQRREQEFVRIRAYPGTAIPAGARTRAVREMERMIAREKESAKLTGRAAAAQRWTSIGPRPINFNPRLSGSGAPFTAGRITALAIDPRDN